MTLKKSEEISKNLHPNNLQELAIDSVGQIISYLPLTTLGLFGRTCKQFRDIASKQFPVAVLLQLIANGEQDAAEIMIKKDPSLLLKKGTLTDFSGRTFIGITAFQYALWALDKHMWRMILNYLPQGKASTQLIELETEGTEHGKHYTFKTFKEALKKYCDEIIKMPRNGEKIAKLWRDVAIEQSEVPVHVASEHCREDRNGSSISPSFFKEDTLPRITHVDIEGTKYSWYSVTRNGQGCMLAQIAQNNGHGAVSDMPVGWKAKRYQEFVDTLSDVRCHEFDKTKEELLSVATVNSRVVKNN